MGKTVQLTGIKDLSKNIISNATSMTSNTNQANVMNATTYGNFSPIVGVQVNTNVAPQINVAPVIKVGAGR